MYCPKCNLHSEEYVDKCPLCDGPMEVDEVASGVMKTPPIPEDGGTEELPYQEAIKLEEDLGDYEPVALDQEPLADEAADIEALDGVEDLDASESSEFDSELEEPPGEPELPPEIPFEPEESGGSNKSVFIGLLLLVILLAGAGYYYFMYAPQTAEPTKKSQKEVAATQKAPPIKTSVTVEEGVTAEALMTKAAEPADLAMQTELEPLAEEATDPGETKTDEVVLSVEEATVVEEPQLEETAPIVVADVTPETDPAVAAPAPSLSPRTPAEMALEDAKKALEEEPLPSASPDGQYLVSVSSFREESLAVALKDKLIQSGYPASTLLVELPEKGTWYRVLVGGYATNDDAGVVSERIKAEENLDTWITKK